MRLLTILLLCFSISSEAQHPVAFATKQDLSFIAKNLQANKVLNESFRDIRQSVDAYLGKDVDVPLPKDPQGGYTHDRHKENYMLLFNAGLLYNITGEIKYAQLARNIFLKYAKLNPTLGNHPQATSSSPGHLFWQALNDANWLVYAGLAYDLIYNALTSSERKQIEEGAFKPEVDFITKDLESWFNLIHNHGVWACAGVGITGIATGNEDYIQKALYGTKKDGKSGFLAQMDGLFSPDGYYTEGPYYVRYAILPYYLFANALHHSKPGLKIFDYRNQILRKALHSGLQQTNTDGRFFPLNDAIKEKDFTTNEIVTAINIARAVYGPDKGLLSVAVRQNRVILHKGGVQMAAELKALGQSKLFFPYKSIEYVDGAKGDQGGVSLLRWGREPNLTTLVYKYASHGLSHGHFDRLGYFLFDNGKEVMQDYGAVRFIGVEQKYGGRYLPENKSYAAQTIAHNTLVVDEQSHFNGREEAGEKYHSEKQFSDITRTALQVVSAKEENAYTDVKMYRTLYMVSLPGYNKPFVIDIFRTISTGEHQYDLPFQYSGNVIHTSFSYKPFISRQEALGKKNGYQFLWKEAEAIVRDTTTQFTFLNGTTYYTISSLVKDSAIIIMARTGANDPNFNLRHEPSYIIRSRGGSECFVNVLEPHGKMDPVAEFSTNSYPSVQRINLLKNDVDYTMAEIIVKNKSLLVIQSNKEFSSSQQHKLNHNGKTYQWTGPYTVMLDGKTL